MMGSREGSPSKYNSELPPLNGESKDKQKINEIIDMVTQEKGTNLMMTKI